MSSARGFLPGLLLGASIVGAIWAYRNYRDLRKRIPGMGRHVLGGLEQAAYHTAMDFARSRLR